MEIYRSQISSPLGILNVASTNKGVCMLEFDNEIRISKTLNTFSKLGYSIVNQENNHIHKLKIQLDEYFNSKRTEFDISIDMIGSGFQTKVWTALLNIPFGVTKTYKDQSIVVGDLKAIRAVATANGANKISILIPCHRVIGSDGSLTGYGGELWRKQFLLDLENNQKKLL